MNISQVKAQHPIYLTDVILIHKKGRNNFYIDPRTKIVSNEKAPTVKPFAWNHTYLWIVCPFCQKIHEYPILLVRQNKFKVYGNCKGRSESDAIYVDCKEMKT